MEKVTFWQYQKIIIKGSARKFSQRHGIRDVIVSAVAGLIMGIATGSLLIALATIGVFAIIYGVIFLYYYAMEHVYVYNEQERRVNLFLPKNLDVLVYESDAREMKDEKGKLVSVLTFEVVNGDKTRKIMELEAEIFHVNQTSIENGYGPMTIPFFPEQKVFWEGSASPITITLRPEGRALLFIAFLDRRAEEYPFRVHFGNGAFTNHLFDREAMYQIEIKLTGRMDGEVEFRTARATRLCYANPTQNILYSGDFVKHMSLYDEIPKPLLKVLKVAEQGFWQDYSSPYRRQQEQKQKEARDATKEAKRQAEAKKRTKK